MPKSTVTLYLRISPEVADKLENYVKKTKESKNAVAETALKEYLEKKEGGN